MKTIDIEDGIRCVYPMRTYLLTAEDERGKTNIIAVDWLTVLSRNPPLIGIAISPKRYSHNLIISSKEFVVNIPAISMINKVLACGTLSGRNTNKFERLELTKFPTRTLKTNIIEECVAFIECKLVDFKDYGDHTFFVGNIQTSYAKEEFLKEFKPILHTKGNSFTTTTEKIVKAEAYHI